MPNEIEQQQPLKQPLKQMVTSKEVMAYLGISRKTLYRYEQEKGLPRYKLNRTTCRYDMDEVKAWAEERKQELYGLNKDLNLNQRTS